MKRETLEAKLADLRSQLDSVQKEIPYTTAFGGKPAYRRACARRDKISRKIAVLSEKLVAIANHKEGEAK